MVDFIESPRLLESSKEYFAPIIWDLKNVPDYFLKIIKALVILLPKSKDDQYETIIIIITKDDFI